MMKSTGRVFLSQVLRGEPLAFESTKTIDEHLERTHSGDIVYEDEHTVAYIHPDDAAETPGGWELKFAIALKKHVPTLLDLDVADGRSTVALLRAIQAVAFKYRLYEKGFEIHIDILPPLQRKGFLEVKVRSGRRKAGAQYVAPHPG